MKQNRSWFLVFLLILSLAAIDSKGSDEAAALKTRLTAVSLFKNGLGFVSREGELPKGEATVVMEGLPEAIHGTFWAYSPDGADIKDLVASEQEKSVMQPAIHIAELLEANAGQSVEIRTADKETIKGKILSVPVGRSNPGIPSPYNAYQSYRSADEAATMLLLQTEDGIVAINKGDVRELRAAQGALKTTTERKTKEVTLQLHSVNQNGKGHVTLQYLTRGITWAPSCSIDISDPGKARLSAKAEIINELEDMDHVLVNLITGFPNLQFADVTDPMALRGDLAGFLSSLIRRSQPEYRGRGDVTMQQQAVTITKELSGEMLKSTPPAKVEQTAKGLKKVNPTNVLTWELPVAALGKLEIEYQYHVYVRE